MTTTALEFSSFASIDTLDLDAVCGGENFAQRLGKNMQSTGEVAMAAGAVGTAIPVLGETGIPEAAAAAGGATWLLGKGVEYIGSWFN